ncbi:MAG: Na+/H+ antiporter subunit E [Coriobacteriia bacterium]|nr:Na+/H+ antiporter subunit E [Coriobacteriia bacterium]
MTTRGIRHPIDTTLRVLRRSLGLGVLWWVVAEGDASSLQFGIPTVLLASAASVGLTPARSWRLRLSRVPRFVAYFAAQSAVGGVDVALRALRPSMPLAPGTVVYPLRLPSVPPRVLMADVLSLLPGTLSVGLTEEVLIVHVLDVGTDLVGPTRRLEDEIAALFGLQDELLEGVS